MRRPGARAESARAYVVACFFLELSVFVSILIYVGVSQWENNGDSLPDISLGFANNPILVAGFISACILALFGRFVFWKSGYDYTPKRALEMAKWGRAWRWVWYARNAGTVLEFAFLIATAGMSKFVNANAHAGFATAAVAFYVFSEILAVIQRSAYENAKGADPLNALLLFVESVLLVVTLATGSCFALRTCVGGTPASAAFEFALFSTLVVTPVIRVVDA